MTKNSITKGRRALRCIAVALFLLVVISIVPAAADPAPATRHIFVPVANDAGVKYDLDGAFYGGDPNTYYIKADGGGLNELHITNDAAVPAGQVTVTDQQSGTFFVSNTGGRGFDDTIVLLLAVKGEIPDDFAVGIKSSGYSWTLSSVVNQKPTDYVYVEGAVDEVFTKADFIYSPQNWKPGPGALLENPGTIYTGGLPLYEYQDMTDTEDTYSLMFIDLYVGNLKEASFSGASFENDGAIKVEYSFTNLETFASFNAYGWCLAANQGQGISWTNRVNRLGETAIGTSVYSVTGIPPVAVPEFPTLAVPMMALVGMLGFVLIVRSKNDE